MMKKRPAYWLLVTGGAIDLADSIIAMVMLSQMNLFFGSTDAFTELILKFLPMLGLLDLATGAAMLIMALTLGGKPEKAVALTVMSIVLLVMVVLAAIGYIVMAAVGLPGVLTMVGIVLFFIGAMLNQRDAKQAMMQISLPPGN